VSVGDHAPVLLQEVLEVLCPERGGLYFDGTLGGGGHSEGLLQRGPEARVIGVDRDAEAVVAARGRLSSFGGRIEIVHGDYATAAEGVGEPLAGALLDLGVSSHQLDEDVRGFSFRRGAPLDMRMSPESGGRTAADLLNELTQSELADVFFHYGEERRARRLAGEVVKRRARHAFATADDLVAALHGALGPRLTAQDKARIFQAVRIAVNAELAQLERALPVLRERLAEEGVLLVISYHSLEDRVVKVSFREWSRECVCPPGMPVCTCRGRALGTELTRKPVRPSSGEVAVNARARSARLRAWRKAA
jgi:16S rRNA (cytosine1402-N4)-methyltransferase